MGNQHSQAASVQQGAECGLAGIPTGDENLNQAKDRVIEVMLCMAASRRRDMLCVVLMTKSAPRRWRLSGG